MMREIHELEAELDQQSGQQVSVISMAFRNDRQSDQRRYNAPFSNEIAMVFVNDDEEPPFQRDIRVYPINPENPNKQFIPLHILSPNMDPMTYPILFPYGESGWHPNWRCQFYERSRSE